MNQPSTMIDKIWERHVIEEGDDADLVYVDFQYLHEASGPQAFELLARQGRTVRRPRQQLATEDHHIPTESEQRSRFLRSPTQQAVALRQACARHGINIAPVGSLDQGIVHVIGPELGITQPGMTVVCGDSHTSTHGAFGALALGIGTSEVAHVLATQALWLSRPAPMRVTVSHQLPLGTSAKDLALHLMSVLGPGGGQGHAIEYAGSAVRALTMEQRMTVCNMSIEAGARAGLVAPDDVTIDYLTGRAHAPAGEALDRALERWLGVRTDEGARFAREVHVDGSQVRPRVTWGTNPSQSVPLGDPVPALESLPVQDRGEAAKALEYMDLHEGQDLRAVGVDRVFVGSCTNGRIEDLRAVALVLDGRRIAPGVSMVVSPGSAAVKRQAEQEGIDRLITAAGAEWRSAGCSMCIHSPYEETPPGARVASTTNRNFVGRQGPMTRTHLVSPAVAAATAVAGRFSDPSDL